MPGSSDGHVATLQVELQNFVWEASEGPRGNGQTICGNSCKGVPRLHHVLVANY